MILAMESIILITCVRIVYVINIVLLYGFKANLRFIGVVNLVFYSDKLKFYKS